MISYDTAPESVRELVATYRYAKHRIETALLLLKKHKTLVQKDASLDGLNYQDTYDLIELLEDFLDRMVKLERKTFPEDFARKKVAKTATEPSSVA